MTRTPTPRRTALLSALLLLATAAPAAAADKAAKARAAALDSLAACRAIPEDAQRLACYDKAAGVFDEAEKKGDIVVVDRAQVREVKRQTFGFNFDTLSKVFDGGEKAEQIDRVEATIADIRNDGYGKLVFVTAEGQTWRQIDGELWGDPKKGQKVEIKRATLGSFMMKVGDFGTIRVHRDQ
jgi:hypothetical protein